MPNRAKSLSTRSTVPEGVTEEPELRLEAVALPSILWCKFKLSYFGIHLQVVCGCEAGSSGQTDPSLKVELLAQIAVRHCKFVRLAQLGANGQDLCHADQLQIRHADGHHLFSSTPCQLQMGPDTP